MATILTIAGAIGVLILPHFAIVRTAHDANVSFNMSGDRIPWLVVAGVALATGIAMFLFRLTRRS